MGFLILRMEQLSKGFGAFLSSEDKTAKLSCSKTETVGFNSKKIFCYKTLKYLWGFEQSSLVEGVSAHSRGLEGNEHQGPIQLKPFWDSGFLLNSVMRLIHF